MNKSISMKYRCHCGNIYITFMFSQENKVEKIFAHLGKAGNCHLCILEGVTRLINLGLPDKLDIDDIIKELTSLSCNNLVFYKGESIASCVDAIAKAFKKVISLSKEEEAKDVK